MIALHVSSLSAFVFAGRRADAGRTAAVASLAEASAYFFLASAALFWAVAAARRRAVSRAPVWKSTSESGAAVLPKSRGQNRHAPSGSAAKNDLCTGARAAPRRRRPPAAAPLLHDAFEPRAP